MAGVVVEPLVLSDNVVVLPGDVIPVAADTKVILGPGLRAVGNTVFRLGFLPFLFFFLFPPFFFTRGFFFLFFFFRCSSEKKQVVAMKCGLLRRRGPAVWIDNTQKRVS